MLRIAVPNKGSLAEAATLMLKEAGYVVRRDSKELVLADTENDIEFFYLRPRDIAVYVGSGTLDGGITGRDLLLDSGADAVEVLPLGFARSTFRFAGRPGVAESVTDLAGQRIATSYTGLVRRHLQQSGIEAEVVRLDGAVETSITLGVADVIADVVETGTTLRNQGLVTFGEPILHSEAVLIARDEPGAAERLRVLNRRLSGVITARTYVMMDYDIRVELLEEAARITPGLESPTVSPLRDEEFVAVRSMVRRKGMNRVMDALYALGARGILVTDIAACRL
ncbi:ATP phosphoribosyltransferase [Gephyromycinifex aptenodytis]|uniref:ATP phosphoribosyltransferase n=1 Tax=Gephyromycinifex aptenodytis TaxID=2716227 RepID=UPI001446805E|nr:ATP phosphoribosyltransferase [Gephyromycinifex aptenodytis]